MDIMKREGFNKEEIAVYEELKKFKSEDMYKFFEFAANAGAYGVITSQAQQYIRDIQVVDLLNTKFMNKGMFKSARSVAEWIEGIKSRDFDLLSLDEQNNRLNQIYRTLQGHGAGEVDFVRYINGSLKGLFYKAEIATNEAGKVVSNLGGYDVVIRNRFTNEIIQRVQVKSNWTSTPENITKTLNDFLKNRHYDADIVLAGPKELIDEAKRRGIPNPTIVRSSAEDNLDSAERLAKLGQKGQLTNTVFSVQTVKQIGKGGLVAGAVSCGISSIQNYIAYRKGDIDMDTAFKNIAVDSARGFVTGAALKGVSMLLSPGLIGLGMGLIISIPLKKLIDASFGKGDYEVLLKQMQVDQSLAAASANFAITTYNASRTCEQFASVMDAHANNAIIIDHVDSKLDKEIEIRLKEI